ncbi:uncharacterized protein LOC143144197 isoform X2 [Ptiloglossa arizonensis]|uniref:uncharacterized protein LOC143144197 isoform X2 n=1 Tax=Ptiloglossa arizonensis TaxID=3350558 RepID=UPI003F9FAC89
MNKNVNMCDLIDLNSPDRKGLLSSQLASPLIPVPTDMACSNCNNHINDPSSLVTGKRSSFENNPFDMVLHKTTEYIQKKDDPFEVTLEKALRSKCKKHTSIRTYSCDFKNDSILKEKKYTRKLKINRTLDESLINEELNQKNVSNDKIPNGSIIVDSNNTNVLDDDVITNNINLSFSKNTNNIPTINIQENELSILNQSVMDDTLFEAVQELSKEQMKSISQNKISINMEKDKLNTDQISTVTVLKIPKLQRSLSQGEKILPKKSKYLNQTSLVEPSQTNFGSSNSISSLHSLDLLNEGFLNSLCSKDSVFSSLSNISSITRLNSISSTSHSSMILSDGTINRTFLDTGSFEKSDNTKLIEKMDSVKETNSVLPISRYSITSVTDVSNKTKSPVYDLADQFNKLRDKFHVSENSTNEKNEIISEFSDNIKQCVAVIEKNEECNTNNRLIDIDICTSDMNCSEEHHEKSISDTSSDSVFVDENKINKSILHEAKLLAKTFEELALKPSSESSIDDLIGSNSSWTAELLPAFDDEAMTDNLIELPTSPNVNNLNSKNEKVMECTSNDSYSNTNGNLLNSKVGKNMKDLETELIEPISTEKRITTATLLLDLKKLITTEENIEANKLLENLEKVLGINWENNTELLTTYLNTTNNLSKSPQKSSSCLEIKNVTENNMEYSREDNLTSGFPNDVKESVICTNMNFNDSSKVSKEYLKEINSKADNENLEAKTGTKKLETEINESDLDNQNVRKKDFSCKTDNNNSLNEKIATELLTNIAKLLTRQTEDYSTLDILKNLGKVLNFASNNCNIDENLESNNNDVEIQTTSKKSKLKFENKTRTSTLSRSKKVSPGKNFIRKKLIVSQTPPIKNVSSSVISKGKNTSQLKEVTKRFSSDPDFISSTSNKKVIAKNNKSGLEKDIETITIPTLNLQKEKTTMINTIKTKLKTKSGSDIAYKKGPLKAVLPMEIMQKKDSICTAKKYSRSSKPMASSTPDAQNSKPCKIQSQITNCSKKRNFSCDISPVTTRVNVNSNNGINNSPKRVSKLQSPKKTTPKRHPTNSNIPKSQTPPVSRRLNSSFDVNQYGRFSESPQHSLHKLSNSQKNSPISLKKTSSNVQQSPLRNSNKIIHKVKPINLISKLRRHSIGTNVMEKENNYI